MKSFMRILALVMLLSVLLCGCEDPEMGRRTDPTNDTTVTPSTGLTVPTKPTTEPTDDGKVTYTVTVLDQNNNPVAGVAVQFCDDENCKLPVNTDANGVVTQTLLPSNYHILLAGLPDGYSSDETEFYFGDATELTVVINAD